MMSSSSLGNWIGQTFFFSDILESDTRTPVLQFTIPDIILQIFLMSKNNNDDDDVQEYKFGILIPYVEFWIALAVTLLMGAIFSSCISVIMYYFIIIPQKQSKTKKNNNSHITHFLVGFGIVMPICVVSPYLGLRYFGIKNKVMKFLTGVAQLTSFFRCSEAMFGYLPSTSGDSLKNLLVYMAFPAEIKFDSKGAIQSSWSDMKQNLTSFIKYIFILGMCFSVLLTFDYKPYEYEEGPALMDIRLWTCYSWKQLVNNTLIAILFQVALTTFGFGFKVITAICGLEAKPMMLNPIFESSSVSEFWGRRWNMVIHGLLKRGVYKPVRTKYSRGVASIAAFLASGFFHEWLLAVMFYPDFEDGSCSPMCYTPGYGRNTLFFIWNAMLIALEYALSGAAIFQLFRTHLPVTAVSLMVAMTALPAAHWFTNDYVRSDFFKDMQLGFPLLVRI